MKTTHTTYSCDLVGCGVIVDSEDDYSSLPDGWVTVASFDSRENWAERRHISKMFCGWPHAAEWVAQHAEVVKRRQGTKT